MKLYREGSIPELRCRVINAFLDALWENVPLRLTVLRLRHTGSLIFGLNIVGQQQFESCFDKWYSEKPDRLIGPES